MRILLVDDQSFIKHIYSKELEKHGHTVICAEDGLDALKSLPVSNIDVILLDVIMPNLNGFETCKKIKTNPKTKDIPVIFLTANADKDTIFNAIRVGGSDFVIKSSDCNILLEKLDNLFPDKKT
ncbi:MAG: response regulator [Candidatus Aureabacteria bacterium]|nr:response regulator [Candidatus Auribacterota bacterium]